MQRAAQRFGALVGGFWRNKKPLAEARGSKPFVRPKCKCLEDDAETELHFARSANGIYAGSSADSIGFVIAKRLGRSVDGAAATIEIAAHQIAGAIEVREVESVVEADVRMKGDLL